MHAGYTLTLVTQITVTEVTETCMDNAFRLLVIACRRDTLLRPGYTSRFAPTVKSAEAILIYADRVSLSPGLPAQVARVGERIRNMIYSFRAAREL